MQQIRRRKLIPLIALAALLVGGCSGGSHSSGIGGGLPVETYRVVHTYPHDSTSFTEGLAFDNGVLYESTGLNGASTLRIDTLETGQAIHEISIPSQYFAEGATLFNGKLYQLTWQSHIGFIYDPATLQQTGQFSYDGEGWGLTHDDNSLILSDGTSQIRFLDPSTFQVQRTITVTANGTLVTQLNELEYVQGEIYANVWHTDQIARIDPATGKVIGWIDLTGILPSLERPSSSEGVLNGIAYDATQDRLFVTGKLWPELFEIQTVPK